MDATVKSLNSALESNLRLQAALARRIQAIAEKKASNRRLASRITSQIVSSWEEIDVLRTPALPRAPQESTRANLIVKRKRDSAKWSYDPYRKWTRSYFVDPEGSFPEPNEDVVKRRKLEQGRFFHHRSPPWSKREVQHLLSIVSGEMDKTGGDVEAVDFDKVASILEKRTETDKSRPSTVKPRSCVDCRLKYAYTRKHPPFTKEESIKVLEQVHLHNGMPPWSEIASETNRSTWQCLSAYMTKLYSSRSLPFTPPEDELLLKAVAAMGPQAVLNIEAAADLAARFFPNRAPKQVLGRLNASLVNPNYAREMWSDEEERRLMLCMKVYRETPFPITRVGPHFPVRSSKAVSEKWDRSLNPEYSSKPFTPAEDKLLIEAVRRSPDAGWAELQGLFPSRHPRSLYTRWNEVATEQDLLLKYGTIMKQQGARRGLVKSGGLLSSDDFVVRTKQEPNNEERT